MRGFTLFASSALTRHLLGSSLPHAARLSLGTLGSHDRRHEPCECHQKHNMSPLVASIVIPTRNRPRALQECLDALASQSVAAGTFEVIVVDDGSHQPVQLEVARWAGRFQLVLVRQQNTGPAGARHRGVAEARGEFVAFTDDDCLPTPDWLKNLITPLWKQPEAMVGGTTYNGLKNDIRAETSQLILELVYEHFNSDPSGAYFFASNNIACRRDSYHASGGFDVNFDSPAAEDREFCDRWRLQERPLVWVPEARIEHRHPQSLYEFTRLHYRYGRAAYIYQARRARRRSGTMQADLGFHRSLPARVFGKLSLYPLMARPSIVLLLVWWQFINLLGFSSELIRSKLK